MNSHVLSISQSQEKQLAHLKTVNLRIEVKIEKSIMLDPLANTNNSSQIVHRQLLLPNRQHTGCLDQILDFSPIDIAFLELLKIRISDAMGILAQAIEEILPNRAPGHIV